MMRKMMVGLMLVAMLMVSGLSFAQEPMVMCGGLAEADCAILTQSADAMASVSSATFTLDLSLDAGDQGNMDVVAEGSFEADMAAMGLDATALAGLNASDPTAAMGVLKTLIQGFKGTMNVTLTGSSELGLPGDVNLDLVLVDGIGYMNFKKLATLAGPQGDQMLTGFGITEWAGLDLVGAVDMLGGMAGEMGDMTAEQPDTAAVTEAVVNYISITRGADADGEAVFTTTIDLAGLISDPAFADIMAAQGTEMTEDNAAEAMKVLEGVVITSTSTIDLTTFFQTSIAFDFAISGEALAMSGGTAPSALNLSGNIAFDNFNAAPAVVAPEGPVATIMDLMNMFGGMGGM